MEAEEMGDMTGAKIYCQASPEPANKLDMGNEGSGEFQIFVLSGWWAVFIEIENTGEIK